MRQVCPYFSTFASVTFSMPRNIKTVVEIKMEGRKMKGFLHRTAATLLCIVLLSPTALAARELVPVGDVIGIELTDGTVTIAAFDETLRQQAQCDVISSYPDYLMDHTLFFDQPAHLTDSGIQLGNLQLIKDLQTWMAGNPDRLQ